MTSPKIASEKNPDVLNILKNILRSYGTYTSIFSTHRNKGIKTQISFVYSLMCNIILIHRFLLCTHFEVLYYIGEKIILFIVKK